MILGVLMGCRESKNLESIKIVPVTADESDDTATDTYICRSSREEVRRFIVNGEYADDSEEDLTDEVEWTSDEDASGDSILSSTMPGLITCNWAFGKIPIKATYTLNSSDSNSSGEGETTEFTDTVLVDGQ